MCLHTCSHHAARMTGCAELWPPFCVPTGSAGSQRTPPTRGRAVECPKGPLLLHAPVSSTLCPATRKLSLKHRGDHGLSCSQPSRGSTRSCAEAGALECAPGAQPRPPARSRGLSPLLHCCSPQGLRPHTQSATPTLQAVSLHSSSLSPGLGDFAGALPAFPSVANSLLCVPASPVSSALLPGSAAAAGREEGRTSVSHAGL